MRLPHHIAPGLAALILLVAVPYDAMSDTAGRPHHARVATKKSEKKPELFGAACRVEVERAEAAVSCHNPYPGLDLVALHIECDPWWDIDTDSKPVAVHPAETVWLRGRCWKKIRTAWVSHRKAP